jgi:hypothetical protein
MHWHGALDAPAPTLALVRVQGTIKQCVIIFQIFRNIQSALKLLDWTQD